MTVTCSDCKWYKYYPGSYWDPDDAECNCPDDIPDRIIDRVWCNGEKFDTVEPLCPGFELAPQPEDYEPAKYEIWD